MDEAKRQMREATRAYNKMRYSEDDTYRNKMRTTMRERYKDKRKTMDCNICGKRKPRETEVCLKCIQQQLKALKSDKDIVKALREIANNISDI